MTKKTFALLALLFSIGVQFSIAQIDTLTQLSKEWVLNSKTESFTLTLSADQTYHLQTADQHKKGNWQLSNKQLILNEHLNPALIIVDSIVYQVKDGMPVLSYFHAGKEIATNKGNKFEPKAKQTIYTIDSISASSLGLSSSENRYVLSTTAVAATNEKANAELSFSLNSILRGLLGMLVLVAIAYLFSTNRKAVSWRVVGIGLGIQLVLAFGILKVPVVANFFEYVGRIFIVVLDFTREGSVFLFGSLLDISSYGFIFAFQVLPTIIFFSALTSVLFYFGIIQKIVYGLAWFMTKALKLSGAESLSVAGNVFLGQTESPLLIKAYLEKMNRSEIMLVMTGGMATLAGGVLASYIAFLGGDDPVQRLYFAKHLLAASIMAAPGAVVLAKIIMPQTEEIDTNIEVSKEKIGTNVLDAISNGTTEGLKLAVNVAAMLLSFIAFIAMANFILIKIGDWTHLNPIIQDFTEGQYKGLDLKLILGYIFAPIVWLMGVPFEDITLVGRLIGEKVIMTEFVAYISLAEMKETASFFSEKSIIMSTYALAGFANFASIGIQIGGIGALAPSKRQWLSEFGLRALLAGSLASLMSATIVGMFLV